LFPHPSLFSNYITLFTILYLRYTGQKFVFYLTVFKSGYRPAAFKIWHLFYTSQTLISTEHC